MTRLRFRRACPGLVASLVALPVMPNAQLTAQWAGLEALRSATRGLTVLDSAIAANGGLDRLRAVEDLTIRYRGRRWMAYQSKNAVPPWTTQPTLTDLVVDIKNNRIWRYSETRYPADFLFASAQILNGPNAIFYDPTRAGFGDVISKLTGPPNPTMGSRREVPALELLQARDRSESVRWAGERNDGGRRLQGVSYAQPNGAVYTLWIDAATKRLARMEWLRDDPVDGDQLASYDYSGYRMENAIPVPTRLVERRNGELVRDDSLAITIDTHPADSVFAAPKTGYGEGSPITGPRIRAGSQAGRQRLATAAAARREPRHVRCVPRSRAGLRDTDPAGSRDGRHGRHQAYRAGEAGALRRVLASARRPWRRTSPVHGGRDHDRHDAR